MTEDSHEISYIFLYFFSNILKDLMSQNLSSAAVVIGGFRVNGTLSIKRQSQI